MLSDLHLETQGLYETFEIPSAAKYLILAGDIGRLCDTDRFLGFLDRHQKRFERMFLVLGNHEFYGLTREEGLEIATSFERQLSGKLVVMNRTVIDIGYRVTLLGCTLHSYIDPQHFDEVSHKVKDFKRIKSWGPADHNNEHARDVAWLHEQMKTIHWSRRIVICTHHAPTIYGTIDPRHGTSIAVNSAFATELISGDATWWRGTIWIYGHTHYNGNQKRRGVIIRSNQRGYFQTSGSERPGNGFNANFTINV